MVPKTSLIATARHQLEHARVASSGRSATSVFGGHERVLRQTVIALRRGVRLEEHPNPGEATIYVLQGRVALVAGETTWHAMAGDLLTLTEPRHSLEAEDDCVILLTVAKIE
jgi:quercetin dioxygenase-like cupin family protein